MTARDYITQHGGAWPAPTAPPAVAPESAPLVERLQAASHSADFARVLEVCRGCDHFREGGWVCYADPGRCGGCSVRLMWAQDQGCPLKKW